MAASERERHTEGQQFAVLHQTKELLVVDKPPDVRMDGDYPITVEKWVQKEHAALCEGEGRKLRFCHQLDHATSGVLALAFTKQMAAQVAHCFERRIARKQYLALVHGHPPLRKVFTFNSPVADDPSDPAKFKMCIGRLKESEPGSPDAKRRQSEAPQGTAAPDAPGAGEAAPAPAGELPVGRAACTHCVAVQHGAVRSAAGNIPCSLAVLAPATGRRHQLRVHCVEWGHPIVGDLCYHPADKDRDLPRMMLHAWRLELPCDTRDTAELRHSENKAERKRMRKEKQQVQEPPRDVSADEVLAGVDELLGRPAGAEVTHPADGAKPRLLVRTDNRLRGFLLPADGAPAGAGPDAGAGGSG
eukprot:TRINITY_DN18518_c0_g1_i1.p1 TRINITY_DN18518_c0_g1~~TRINITY_DN18518_c0_g1_i1.p1  ORF type:complete len:384 (+),score=123.63 TRINITY_DN18518_c0_g1_i1:78-1154(+)